MALRQCWFSLNFKNPTWWAIIPIGAEVKFYPLSLKDQGRVHQFGTTVLCGIFMEYALNEGEVGLVIF